MPKVLHDTVDMMTSTDYKERFKAEYWQTKIRYDKLHQMIVKYDAKALDFTLSCDIEWHRRQAKAMGEYLYILKVRALIEGIEL